MAKVKKASKESNSKASTVPKKGKKSEKAPVSKTSGRKPSVKKRGQAAISMQGDAGDDLPPDDAEMKVVSSLRRSWSAAR